MDKQTLIKEIEDYLKRVSNLKPAPTDYILKILDFKEVIQASEDEAELAQFATAWERIKNA